MCWKLLLLIPKFFKHFTYACMQDVCMQRCFSILLTVQSREDESFSSEPWEWLQTSISMLILGCHHAKCLSLVFSLSLFLSLSFSTGCVAAGRGKEDIWEKEEWQKDVWRVLERAERREKWEATPRQMTDKWICGWNLPALSSGLKLIITRDERVGWGWWWGEQCRVKVGG